MSTDASHNHDNEPYSLIETDELPVQWGRQGKVDVRDDRVLIPQIPAGHSDTMPFVYTVAYDLLAYGYELADIQQLYSSFLSDDVTEDEITDFIETNGRWVIDSSGSLTPGAPNFQHSQM